MSDREPVFWLSSDRVPASVCNKCAVIGEEYVNHWEVFIHIGSVADPNILAATGSDLVKYSNRKEILSPLVDCVSGREDHMVAAGLDSMAYPRPVTVSSVEENELPSDRYSFGGIIRSMREILPGGNWPVWRVGLELGEGGERQPLVGRNVAANCLGRGGFQTPQLKTRACAGTFWRMECQSCTPYHLKSGSTGVRAQGQNRPVCDMFACRNVEFKRHFIMIVSSRIIVFVFRYDAAYFLVLGI